MIPSISGYLSAGTGCADCYALARFFTIPLNGDYFKANGK